MSEPKDYVVMWHTPGPGCNCYAKEEAGVVVWTCKPVQYLKQTKQYIVLATRYTYEGAKRFIAHYAKTGRWNLEIRTVDGLLDDIKSKAA